MAEYKRIMKLVPDYYKVKIETKSLTQLQILAIFKLFLDKDTKREGWIKYGEMVAILIDLQFRASNKEVEEILRGEYEDFSTNIENERVNFNILIRVCDILKREKLILVQFGNYLNYMIFLMLLMLIVIYIAFFYSYKSQTG